MATSTRGLQTGWIKLWISIGLVVSLIGMFLPAAMRGQASREVQRYQECAAGRRDDCRPSLIWVFYEQALKNEGGNGLLLQNIQTESSLYR